MWAIAESGEHYSFIGLLFRPAFLLGGYWGIGVLLALVIVLTIFVTECLIYRLTPLKPVVILALALVCNFMIALFIPRFWSNMYLGTITGNLWHNPTYEVMRLFALIAIYFYLKICNAFTYDNDQSKKNMPILDWIIFCAAIIVATLIKPSFAVVFGPTLVIICVIDLIKDRSTLKRSLGIALCLFITLAILFIQYKLIYVDDTANRIAFGFADNWKHWRDDLGYAMLQSFIFPLIVFVGCYRYFFKTRNGMLAFSMFIIGFCIYIFVYEDGPRFSHGNMSWSLLFATYYLNITCVIALITQCWRLIPSLCARKTTVVRPTIQKAFGLSKYSIFFIIALAVLLVQGIDGVVWFIYQLLGFRYSSIPPQ